MLPHDDSLPPQPPNYIDPPAEADSVPSRVSVEGDDFSSADDRYAGSRTTPPALAGGPSVKGILQGLKRRWWQALGLGVVFGAVASAAAWVVLEPPHTAFAQIRIATVRPWIVNPKINTPEHRNEFLAYQKLQAAQIRGRWVLNAALKRPEVKVLDIIRQQPDPLLWLEEQVKVESQESSELMTINMTGTDPETVKTLVNGVYESYFDEVVKVERKVREERLKELEKIVDEVDTALTKSRNEFNDEAKSLGTSQPTVLPIKQVNLIQLLAEKRRQMVTVQFQLKGATSRLKAYQDQGPTSAAPPSTPAPQPMPVPQVVVSEQNILEAQARDTLLKELLSRQRAAEDYASRCERHLYEGNATLTKARQNRSEAQAQAEQRRDDVRSGVMEAARLQAAEQLARANQPPPAAAGTSGPLLQDQIKLEIAALTQQSQELQAEVDTLSAESENLNLRSTRMEKLSDDIRREGERLAGYKNELESLRIELRPNVPPRVTKFQDAGLQRREPKRQILASALAPFVVLAMVSFLIGFLESRKRSIHSADDVARGLNMPVVGGVPEFPRHPGEEFEQVLMESMDGIRTKLLREAHRHGLQVIMVTSAAAGEGKTTLASQLAGSLARAGRRTLLIDCDLRRPAAHQLFELPLQPGLSEVLLDEVHLAEATRATDVEGLWMVPAGQWDRDVVQALARSGLQKIFDRARQTYDVIVLDTHPVLAATDSLLIGQHADAVLLAVMREVSQAPKVYAAFQRLASLNIHVLGAVVSGLPEKAVFQGACDVAVPALR